MEALHQLPSGEDRDRLIHILESSLKVRQATQFFAWTQGPLQALLPHEILICGHDAFGYGDLKLRYFTATRYFKQEHFEAACNQRQGLVARAVRHWREVRRPCLVPNNEQGGACDIATVDMLTRLELKNMAAHGLLGAAGEVQSWFCLSRVPNLGKQTAHVLELLLPCLSATYARMVAHESGDKVAATRIGNVLTAREVQVLEMVRDGMSNADIAVRLSLSIMTAKNHMQNIRKKLEVHTRGQAVAEAIRLSLIRPARGDS